MGRSKDEFSFIVLTPSGPPEASLAIAASRADALGVLNLEFTGDLEAAERALVRLERFGKAPYGVLVNPEQAEMLDLACSSASQGLGTVVLASAGNDLPRVVERIHGAGRQAWLVVTDVKAARQAAAAEVDALIARGHEAGGWVGEETSFVLLQHLAGEDIPPVYLQGGIGLHTVAAARVGGAAGVVLDSQLLLTKESPLDDKARARLAAMDGSETAVLGTALGLAFRTYARADVPLVEELRRQEADAADKGEAARESWCRQLVQRVDWSKDGELLAVGQDAAFAADLARRFRTTGGVIEALRRSLKQHVAAAASSLPLAEGSALAQSHRTRFPIVQGPMTRVSDRAAFANEVSLAGGLPFLALALMRRDEIRALLAETKQLLAERSWGVGILGFVPPDLRAEQLEVVREFRPPFALIAGGRPDQARVLEGEGIETYLHVPSPGLLKMFLEDGARRFVFEGRECGGHVGPRTSFVLWETMINELLTFIDAGGKGDFHVLFAGGVHDGRSAAMVSAMAAPLAERNVRVGVLIGTAYLFTHEAVSSGAILPGFQEAALGCDATVILEAAPGYATRCLPSPFVDVFQEEKLRLVRSGASPEEVKERLEELNIGRLRIASKGVDHNPLHGQQPDAPRLIDVEVEEQWRRGMYMIGQVAALRRQTCSLAELHADVSAGSTSLLEEANEADGDAEPAPPPAAVAIVGMASIVPGASDLQTFWANILDKVDAVTEVPPDRWGPDFYFDPDRNAPDKVYSKWGGFIDEVPFDPLEFGMPPNSLLSIEPYQLLALAVVRDALANAGYLERPFNRERTSVVLGAGGGAADLTAGYIVRSTLPALFGDMAPKLTEHLKGVLPEWTEDSFPGLLMNVAAGRVANRFDFGGTNYTVDAACASSLAAIYLAVRDLEARTSDVVVAGGIDGIQNAFGFLCFSKTQALSPNGRSRPFSDEADGIAISEGFAAVVLKRLEDAERDGDRIYAVIRGVGGSSDGRDRSLTAPRPAGQVRAFQRAYAQAGFSPATVGLIEAHGTGTVAGDQAEVQSLTTVFSQAGAERQATAIGSVKSMIGHTKATAGVAGLIKVALALHHRVLPPTLGVTRPNPRARFEESPFYVNTEARPWVRGQQAPPRRAGVSSFGFGGTNFHVALEEYDRGFLQKDEAPLPRWPAELFVWRGASASEVLADVQSVQRALDAGAKPRLADLALSLWQRASASQGQTTLALVAESLESLRDRLATAVELLQGNAARVHQQQGIHFSRQPLAANGKVAFLFPGQGSQTVNMGRELAIAFPEVREAFDFADGVLAGKHPKPLSRYVFPPPAFTPEEEKAQQAALTETDVAQPALGAVELGVLRLLRSLGVEPDMTAGHSYGEFVALHAAGAIDETDLLLLSEARGRFMKEGAGEDSGTMAAVSASPEALREMAAEFGIVLANLNSPRQTVISGATKDVERAVEWCKQRDITARPLTVACAFHSPLVAPAQKRLAEVLASMRISSPRVPAFSNTTAAAYPSEPDQIVAQLAEHLARPVEWVRQVQAMYDAGARLFVEAGPRQVLSGLVSQILGERDYLALPVDVPGRPGLVQFLNVLAALLAEGVSVAAERLFRGRDVKPLNLDRLAEVRGELQYSPTTWLVSGGGVRPANGKRERAQLPLRIQIVGDAPAQIRAGVKVTPAQGPSASADGASASITHGPSSNGHVAPQAQPQASQPPAPGTTPASTPEAAPALNGALPMTNAAGADVIEQFQQVMRHFLQVQESVMLAALGVEQAQPQGSAPAMPSPVPEATQAGASLPDTAAPVGANGPSPSSGSAPPTAVDEPPRVEVEPSVVAAPAVDNALTRDEVASRLLAVVSDRTGYPPEALSLDADLEADLGVDSIKRVEVAGAMLKEYAGRFSRPPEVESLSACRSLNQFIDVLMASLSPAQASGPAAQPAIAVEPAADKAAPGPEALRAQLLAVVSDRTGYPPEALNFDADLEADLGIDSIKRVEIAGAMLKQLAGHFSQPPEVESLTACRTLKHLAERLTSLLGAGPSASAPSAPAAKPGPQREEVRAQLLAVVSDRTGYPPEALHLDADLEADLGIDSIKRVEIGGAMLKQLSDHFSKPPEVEQLSACRSLSQLLDVIMAAIAGDAMAGEKPDISTQPQEAAAAIRPLPAHNNGATPVSEVKRYVLGVGPAPAAERAGLAEGTAVVIFDAAAPHPLGKELAARLQKGGRRVLRVVLQPEADADAVVFDNAGTTLEWLRHRVGSACALVLVPGADDEAKVDAEAVAALELSKALRADLEAAAASGGAALLAVTRLGGAFGCDGSAPKLVPLHAWAAGLVKTARWEWPSVRSRVVDLQEDTPDRMAERVLRELFCADDFAEVGYRKDDVRLATQLRPEALPEATSWQLSPDDVILVTGGARGITAECALTLAQRCPATFVLVGRTPAPSGPESPETTGVTDERELKRILFEQLKREGGQATPAEIEARYQRLVREREVAGVLSRFAATGARAIYLNCDVQDSETFAQLIQHVYAEYGRIDAVLHGAGVIEDRLIADKTGESFRRVFDTKVKSALTLAAKLRPESLKCFVLFSSVSGRFGNRGQADYAAGNEVLNKLAQKLDANWPGRVVAVNWGPWAAGMVSPAAEAQFGARGMKLISPATGCDMLLRELASGRKGQAEVLVASMDESRVSGYVFASAAPHKASNGHARNGHSKNGGNGYAASVTVQLPLLEAQAELRFSSEGLEVVRELNLEHDLYLHDHVLDGKPVVPFTVALEFMAEAAKAARPDLSVLEAREIRALRGIVLQGDSLRLQVRVQALPVPSGEQHLQVTLSSEGQQPVTHYRALFIMGKPSGRTPRPIMHDGQAARSGIDKSVRELYDQLLFHGPLFERIERVDALDASGGSALLLPSSPAECLAGAPSGSWLLDPIQLDAALQLHTVWSRLVWDMTVLPSSMVLMVPFAEQATGAPLLCRWTTRPDSEKPVYRTDFALTTPDGTAVLTVEGFEATGSEALNRLPAAFKEWMLKNGRLIDA